jgi:lysophospholipase L1-like esterase
VCKYEADGTFIGYEGSWTGTHIIDLDCAYIRIVIASSNVGDGILLESKYTTNSFKQLTKNSIVYQQLDPTDYESKLSKVLFPCMFNATNTWSDIPDESETQYMFICVKGHGSAYMQFAFLLTSPIFYTRVVDSSSATSWAKFDSSNETNTLMYRVPPVTSAAGLLSNVLEPCMFNAVASDWDDLPDNETSVIFVNIKGNLGNAYMQLAYPLNASKFYSRVVAPGVVNTWIKYSCSEQSHSGGYPVYTEGKKCGCLGDSITFGLKGTSWVTKLEDYCGFDTAINYGVSGSTIKSNGSNGFIDRYTSMAADLDYIVVWGGVNDFMWTDQTKAEFKTAYETLISGLLTRYPAAKFLAITPMKFEYTDSDAVGIKSTKYNVPRADGIVLKDYVDAEIEVLNKYSMPYIDFFNVGGISCESAAQAAAYFASSVDKLHPNTNGNLLILAPKISEALKRL